MFDRTRGQGRMSYHTPHPRHRRIDSCRPPGDPAPWIGLLLAGAIGIVYALVTLSLMDGGLH